MNKVIVSFARGHLHESLLNIALPRFYDYALKHDYDIFVPSYKKIIDICCAFGWNHDRPASWLKIPIIKHLVEIDYDIVLWLDCDIFINHLSQDISETFNSNFVQGFVIHQDLYEGLVPNMGVWILNKFSTPILDAIWKKEHCLNHKWWEQGAAIELLEDSPELWKRTLSLPYDFNVHKNDIRYNSQNSEKDGCFLHATCYNNRIEKMKEWAFTHGKR
jgi:hypothetical protein